MSKNLQAQYSTQGEIQHYFFEENVQNKIQIDTGLVNFEQYSFENTDNWEFFNSSILGTAQQNLSFRWNKSKGFQDGNIFFDNYKYHIDKIRYFENAKYPYSEIFYAIGTKLEQRANLIHAQNIKNRFQFATEFQGISSSGFYSLEQRTRNFGFSSYGIFESKNQRYLLETNLTYSSVKASEIGGLTVDILEEPNQNKLFFDTQLSDAINTHSTLSLLFKNSYSFGFERFDTINDSLSIRKHYAVFKGFHSIGTNIVKQDYIDVLPDSSFYQSFYFQPDTLSYNLRYHNIPHRVSLKYFGTRNTDSVSYRNLEAEIALQHNNLEIAQNGFERTYNNLLLDFTLNANPNTSSSWYYKFNTSLFLAGYNQLDFSFSGDLKYNFKKGHRIKYSLLYQSISPTWIENYYHSESKAWQNDFDKKSVLEHVLEYEIPKYHFKIGLQYNLLGNYIYFNQESSPIQHQSNINYINFFIQKNFQWKIWHWNTFVGYQYSNRKEILPLPDFYLKSKVFVNLKLFKGNMNIQTGLDMRYNSAFQTRAWNPLIAQFYIQNESLLKYTPIVDAYISSKVKSLRFYVKLNYINEGLLVKNIYKSFELPSNGRSFSLGLSWRFFEDN